MKKYIIAFALVGLFATAHVTMASTIVLTPEQIQALSAAMDVDPADLNNVNELLTSLGVAQSVPVASSPASPVNPVGPTESTPVPVSTTPAEANVLTITQNMVPVLHTMMLGDTSEAVKYMQKILIKKGYLKTTATGYFGPKTKSALIALQKKSGLEPVGFVGPKTLQLLTNLLASN